jgi:hypothetical protein
MDWRAHLLLGRRTGDKDGALAILRQKGRRATPGWNRQAAYAPMIRGPQFRPRLQGTTGPHFRSAVHENAWPPPAAGAPKHGASWTVLLARSGAGGPRRKAEAAKLYPLVLEGMKTGHLFRAFDQVD